MAHPFQRQLTDYRVGNQTRVEAIDGDRTPHPGVSPTSQTKQGVPIHANARRWKCMAIADITLRSFGSNPVWHCHSDDDLLTLFNSTFPLPSQQSRTVFHLDCKTVMRVISALQMKPFALDDWRRLPSPGKLVGKIGQPTSHLWDLIRIYNRLPSSNESAASQDSPGTTGTSSNSYRRNYCHWADDILGHRTQPNKGHRGGQILTGTTSHDRVLYEGRPTDA